MPKECCLRAKMKYNIIHIRQTFGMSQNLADVRFSLLLSIEVLFINKHRGTVKHS